MPPLITPQINLAFQIVILAVVCASFMLKKIHRYFLHGTTMLAGIVLNGISFAFVMGPSLLNFGKFIVTNMTNKLSLAIIAHGVLGGLAEILGIMIVIFWGSRRSIAGCVRHRKLMRITFILWVIALGLGVLLYILIYSSILG